MFSISFLIDKSVRKVRKWWKYPHAHDKYFSSFQFESAYIHVTTPYFLGSSLWIFCTCQSSFKIECWLLECSPSCMRVSHSVILEVSCCSSLSSLSLSCFFLESIDAWSGILMRREDAIGNILYTWSALNFNKTRISVLYFIDTVLCIGRWIGCLSLEFTMATLANI